MNIERFKELFGEEFGSNPDQAKYPKNRKIEPITGIHSWSSESIGRTLNLAVSCVDPATECYVEIGTWRGFTLCSAMKDNPVLALGVDNFSEFGGRPEFYEYWPKDFPAAKFYEMDCWKFFEEVLPVVNKSVGVYFYDAAHHYEAQCKSWAYIDKSRKLSDNAIIVVDDTKHQNAHIRKANAEWIATHPEYKMIYDLGANDSDRRDGWWCGLQVFEYRRRK